MNQCLLCGSLTPNPKFCNRSCAAKHNNRLFPKRKQQNKCKDCGIPIKPQRIRCQSCNSNRPNAVISEWKLNPETGMKSGFRLRSQVRNYLLEQSNHQCSHCGWNEINPVTGKAPLQIDHIDGNCGNAEETNLRVLCPNCHSLTHNFGALNIGNGNLANRQRLLMAKLIKDS